jgi:hypothetical protein
VQPHPLPGHDDRVAIDDLGDAGKGSAGRRNMKIAAKWVAKRLII